MFLNRFWNINSEFYCVKIFEKFHSLNFKFCNLQFRILPRDVSYMTLSTSYLTSISYILRIHRITFVTWMHHKCLCLCLLAHYFSGFSYLGPHFKDQVKWAIVFKGFPPIPMQNYSCFFFPFSKHYVPIVAANLYIVIVLSSRISYFRLWAF